MKQIRVVCYLKSMEEVEKVQRLAHLNFTTVTGLIRKALFTEEPIIGKEIIKEENENEVKHD